MTHRKNLKFSLFTLFGLLLTSCKLQNAEISNTQKVGNYTYIANVSYYYNREKMKFDVRLPNSDKYEYSIPPESVFCYNLKVHNDNGRVYNEFVLELQHLYIYES